MAKLSHSILDLDDDWAGVDAWEDPGILAAAETAEAVKRTTDVKMKLESQEKKHALLAESAKGHLEEMASLLKKVELSTTTRDDMVRLSELDEEMKRLKADLTASKSVIRSYYSADMVKSMTKAKTYDLMKTAKRHDIKSVIRFVREAETVDLAFLLDCTGSMAVSLPSFFSSTCLQVQLPLLFQPFLPIRTDIAAQLHMQEQASRFTPKLSSLS